MNNFITQPSRPRKLGLLIFCEKGGKDLEKDANKTFITAACTGDRSESAAYEKKVPSFLLTAKSSKSAAVYLPMMKASTWAYMAP